MACRILSSEDNSINYACLYDSVTMTAFGPVFSTRGDANALAELFITFVWEKTGSDPRRCPLTHLDDLRLEFEQMRDNVDDEQESEDDNASDD